MEDDTSPETPGAKRRFSTNQAVHLVNILQAFESRISALERNSTYLQCRIDRSISSVTLDNRRKEIQDDTLKKLEDFINSLDEDERPSQSIIVNVNKTGRPTKGDLRGTIYRTANIVGIVAGIIAGIIYGLYQIKVIK